MASSFHMLAAGFCLLIVCTARLSLTAPVDDVREGEEEYDETVSSDKEDGQTTINKQNETAPSTLMPSLINSTQLALNQSKNTTTEIATTSGTSKSTSSTMATSSTITSTTSTPPEGTKKPDVDKSTENGPAVVVSEPEHSLPWSHSTWASVVVPVSVGLGSALFLIAWICCVRRVCCGKCGRWRSPPYKERLRSTAGPAKKALREDFRQLRAKDRMKLLAESSDEEF